MHYLFRKGIKILAGLGLLFLYNCATINIETPQQENQGVNISTLFPKERKSLIYLNGKDNTVLIKNLTTAINLDEQALTIIEKSREVYLAFDQDISLGMDAVINGDYSKRKYEFGLFFSLDWKKVSKDGRSYWINKKGMKLYFNGNEQIIMSNFDIIPIIKNLEHSVLEPPVGSIVLILPNMNDEQNMTLSNGFIKGGINSLSIYLNKVDNIYEFNGILSLESNSKAKSFTRLINIFLKILLSASNDDDIVRISEEFKIKAENSDVLVDNITLKEDFLIELINKIIFYGREADK